MINLSKVLREGGWRGRGLGGLFGGSRISNFFKFEFYSLERVLDGVNAENLLVAAALVDAVLSVLLVLTDFHSNSFAGSLDDPERGGEISKRMRLGTKFICELPLQFSGEGFKFQI